MLTFDMSHKTHDQVSLELARRVAAGLSQHPEWLQLASENLERWSRQNRNSPSLLRCYAEWNELLSRPVNEIESVLIAETDEGRRLRQNSPFAGVLTPEEVWEIKSQFRRHATATA